MALAFALAAAGRATDEVELAPGGAAPSLPAEIQWELLLRVGGWRRRSTWWSGRSSQPTTWVGIPFDYRPAGGANGVVTFDAVGHGLQAALLAGLAVAALRNARRRRAGLLEQASHANRALHQQFGGERFVTGQVLRLDVPGDRRDRQAATHCPGWYEAAVSSRSGWTLTCRLAWIPTP